MAISNLHRMAIVEDKRPISVLTQSRVLFFLCEHINFLGNLGSMTVGQLQLGYRKVEKIDSLSVTINAFIKILETSKSGIAVVRQNAFEQEELIGNISASDLKDIGTSAELFALLYVPVISFLERKTGNKTLPPPQAVSPSDTISSVLWNFFQSKVHRLFVVNPDLDEQLVGVITPNDVLKLFMSPEYF